MNKKIIAGLIAMIAGAGQASAATYTATADAFVYEFLGSLSAPGPFQTPGVGIWNHETNHGTRGLLDFNSLDSALSSLSAGNFTATLNIYVNCSVGAGGFVAACAGSQNPVTTDIKVKTGGSWNENSAITWASIGEGAKLGSFTVNTDGAGWLSVDATALVEYWRQLGNTGDGVVLTQEAYGVVRNSSNQLAAVLLGDHESGFGAYIDVQAVPVPAAAWLFGSALLGLGGISRRRKA